MTFIEALVELLDLFITFFTTGLFTIGGGQAMIGILENALVESHDWIDFATFQNFVTISESTPGPIVINMATFIGQQLFAHRPFDSEFLNAIMPVVGSLTSTLAVVLPSFVIILIIAKIMDKFINNKYVKFALKGIRPFIIGIIIVAAGKFFYNSANLGAVSKYFQNQIAAIPETNFISKVLIGVDSLLHVVDFRAIFIMVVAFILLRFKKTSHPLVIIGISAVLGILLYVVF